MLINQRIELADLFMLFIYAEILAMVGAFYSTNRIPVTLPIIVAITALCRLIIMQSKDMDGMMVMWESLAILILSGAAYLMSMKDKMSLDKLKDNLDKEQAKDNS
jgi:protein PsiE